MYRNTYVEVNERTLGNNIKKIKSKYSNYEYYIGVVKGNCYGHGFYSVKALVAAGINYLATSSLEEALFVREYEKNIPILCLEPIDIKYIDIVIKNKITLTVESKGYADALSRLKLKDKVLVHLKLDTGMNRLGIKSKKDLKEAISHLEDNKNIEIEGIYTHMATTGIYDKHYDDQVKKFKYLLDGIDLDKVKIIHMGRSLTLVNHKKLNFVNGIRLGIVMYGMNGSMPVSRGIKGFIREFKRNRFIKKYNVSETTRTNDLAVEVAFTLYTEVMSLRYITKGEFVGYGANFIAPKNMIIATLPIGYYDGMDSKLKYVVINKKRYEIVGDICMDMTMVKVDEKVRLHDKVEVFGNVISVKEASRRLGSNAYKLFTRITNRVPRVYQDGSEI